MDSTILRKPCFSLGLLPHHNEGATDPDEGFGHTTFSAGWSRAAKQAPVQALASYQGIPLSRVILGFLGARDMALVPKEGTAGHPLLLTKYILRPQLWVWSPSGPQDTKM